MLIALLYTFPFDLYDRYFNWDQRNLVSARAAVAQMADLTAQRVLATAQFKEDVVTRDFLANMYNIRIFNIIETHAEAFKKSSGRLTFGELYAIGSNLSLNGRGKDAIYFYEESLKKSDRAASSTVNREMGYTLGQKGPSQDIPRARKAYLESISVLADKSVWLDPRFYAQNVSELAIIELHSGDRKCGEKLVTLADTAFSAIAIYDPSIRQISTLFHQTASAAKKATTGQPVDGCCYEVPTNQILFGG